MALIQALPDFIIVGLRDQPQCVVRLRLALVCQQAHIPFPAGRRKRCGAGERRVCLGWYRPGIHCGDAKRAATLSTFDIEGTKGREGSVYLSNLGPTEMGLSVSTDSSNIWCQLTSQPVTFEAETVSDKRATLQHARTLPNAFSVTRGRTGERTSVRRGRTVQVRR